MALRVTRPAFIAGIRALKQSQGIADYDVNTMATRQEMRSFVCGQRRRVPLRGPGEAARLSVGEGVKIEDIRLLRRDEVQGLDACRYRAPVLKAQHPEFELWSQDSCTFRSGVRRLPHAVRVVGALKISNHHAEPDPEPE